MKKCSQCGIEKDIELFNKDKSSNDGHRANCKECSKRYRDENKERDSLRAKEYYKNHTYKSEDYDSEKCKIYYENNKGKIKERMRQNYENNRNEKLAYQKEYQKNNKDRRNKYLSERRENEPMFRLVTNIRNLINNSFYNSGYSKTSRTQEILGCSFEELSKYLESKFEFWMTWENRGIYNGEFDYGWDIDHIIPLSNANSLEELVKLNHYTNLQPLCSKINRDIKKNNLEYGWI